MYLNLNQNSLLKQLDKDNKECEITKCLIDCRPGLPASIFQGTYIY